jgi:hypothetical protein
MDEDSSVKKNPDCYCLGWSGLSISSPKAKDKGWERLNKDIPFLAEAYNISARNVHKGFMVPGLDVPSTLEIKNKVLKTPSQKCPRGILHIGVS